MKGRIAAAIVVAWLIGVASGLGYVAVSGGWYTYQQVNGPDVTESGLSVIKLINQYGCQHASTTSAEWGFYYVRCPRFRLP